MNELTLDGKTYVSSKRAAEITGYAKDYIGQLCREGRVEARLVGRNWYILESSIREHRFGKDAAPKAEREEGHAELRASVSWSAPRYEPESISQIPTIAPRASVNVLEDQKMPLEGAQAPERSNILEDMQTAWQDWFSSKSEEREQIPLRNIEEEPIEEAIEEIYEEEEVPEIESEEQNVPIAIYRNEPETTLDLSKARGSAAEADPIEVPKAEIIHERVITRKKSRGLGPIVIQSLLIALMIVAVAITAIGTGFANKYLGNSVSRLNEIKIIMGETSYSRR